MSVRDTKKRRLRLLKTIAALTEHRESVAVSVDRIHPTLTHDTSSMFGGVKDTDNPSSIMAEDLNVLLGEGLLMVRLTTVNLISVSLSRHGFELVAESEESWLKRMVEKQPITLLQIAFTIILFIWSSYIQGNQRDVERRVKALENAVPAAIQK